MAADRFPALAFPPCALGLGHDAAGRPTALDPVRRRRVRLTPEEWVRQHLLHALLGLGYPAGLTAVEKKLALPGRNWRADVVVWGPGRRPLLVAECKAPSVAITQDAFDQVARYNRAAGARCLVVTNGLAHYVCRVDPAAGTVAFLDALPPYPELQTWARDA